MSALWTNGQDHGEIALETTAVAQEANCRWCSAPLTGRQTAFCSKACNGRWYDATHPRVNVGPEGTREGRLIDAILGVLASGEWMTAHQIAEAVRAFPHSVSARLAELRKRGHRIESDGKVGNSRRPHRFRLVVP